MLICIDVGNSFTGFAVYKGRRLIKSGQTPTSVIPQLVVKLMSYYGTVPNIDIALSSVVPSVTAKISRIARMRRKAKLWVVGKNLRVHISHKYNQINRLGSDRLVNAYGARRFYGAPVLIFDFGTALTCDYVSKKGVFLGGLIVPGAEIALKALSEKTALLPEIPFPRKGVSLLGQNTRSGMEAGILQGYGAMTDGLISRFRKRFGRRIRSVATGGHAKAICRYATQVDVVDPLLTLKGLREVYLDQVKLRT
jgi:type III pantothenate kinase